MNRQFSEYKANNKLGLETIGKFDKYYHYAKTMLETAISNKNSSENTETSTSNKRPSENSEISNNSENIKMATFNLETSLKVIPEFTGNYKDLISFLKIVDIVYKSLDDVSKLLLIDFVYNVKLTNNVRTSLGVTIPTTFDETKTCLSSRFKNNKTVNQIQSTLSNFIQKNMNVSQYNENY